MGQRTWNNIFLLNFDLRGHLRSESKFKVQKSNLDISHRIYADHELEIILRPFLKFVHVFPIRAFTRAFRALCVCICVCALSALPQPP